MIADQHPRQEERLAALARYGILDTEREAAFDEVAELVSQLCEAPIAVVNFIDSDRQWFKAEVGLGVSSTPLDTSLCSHVILEDEFVEIPDTLDDCRMRDNPLCAGETGLRFYAGATLRTDDGLPLGTLCVLDHTPRTLTPLQRQAVQVLARQVMRQLELRLALRNQDVLRREIDHRVKNSLASVAAIIALQMSRSTNREVKEVLAKVQSRLVALSSLHEQLHGAADGATVRLKTFIDRMVEIMASLTPGKVAIETAIEDVTVPAEKASLIGIIVNEFVANSAKHAFIGQETGEVGLVGRLDGDQFLLECSDNGCGSAGVMDEIGAGLGARIIAASASSLDASLQWSSMKPGLKLSLKFPL